MRVVCHRPGGFQFGRVALRFGANDIDAKLWADAIEALNPVLKTAFLSGPGAPIEVEDKAELLFEAMAAPLPEPAEETESTLPLARDKIAAIEAVTDPAELDALEEGEFRKTVIKAIKKRRVILSEGL